jgi:hypothetical protein
MALANCMLSSTLNLLDKGLGDLFEPGYSMNMGGTIRKLGLLLELSERLGLALGALSD